MRQARRQDAGQWFGVFGACSCQWLGLVQWISYQDVPQAIDHGLKIVNMDMAIPNSHELRVADPSQLHPFLLADVDLIEQGNVRMPQTVKIGELRSVGSIDDVGNANSFQIV